MRTVSVELYNRSVYFNGTFAKRRLWKYFRFRPRNYRFMPLYKDGRWDGWIKLFNSRYNSVNSGLFLALKDLIEASENVRFAIKDCRESVRFNDDHNILSDRVYQNLCVRAMQRERSGGLVLSPTASGKTWIVGLYLLSLIGTACFIVDELTLLKQAQEELSKVIGEEVGEVGNQIFDPKRITVATIQTLHRHRKNPRFEQWTKNLSVLIIDEIHIALNRRNIETVKAIKPAIVFGLTATLELNKESIRLPAYALCGPPIFEYHQEEGTEEGFLAPAIVCAVKIIQEGLLGNYHAEYRNLISESYLRNRCIVQLVMEAYAREKHIVVIVERVRHLLRLSKLLSDIPHRVVYGDKEVRDRIRAKKRFEKGDIRLIICNKVFKKGVDIKAIDCIIECSGLSSKNDAIQKLGRGKRTKEGKAGLIYLDINDRSPFRAVKGDDTWNRFHKASRSRLIAFRRRKVPIAVVQWRDNAAEILDIAQAKLDRFVRRLKRGPKIEGKSS